MNGACSDPVQLALHSRDVTVGVWKVPRDQETEIRAKNTTKKTTKNESDGCGCGRKGDGQTLTNHADQRAVHSSVPSSLGSCHAREQLLHVGVVCVPIDTSTRASTVAVLLRVCGQARVAAARVMMTGENGTNCNEAVHVCKDLDS